MKNIPIYNQPTVKDERTAHIYNNLNVNQDMFNTGAAQLTATISNLSGELATSLKKKQNQLEQTKIVELTNAMDAYVNQALYDKDNGYFYKTGSNAMGQSATVMQNYDKYASNLLEKAGLSDQYKQHAQAALIAKRNKVFQAVNKHDFDETNNWQNSVYTQKESNLLNQGILDRNDDKLLEQNLKQAHIAITLQGQVQNWDDATVDLKKKDFTSKYHVAVINGLLGDGSLRAKQYYEAHKDEINPEKHNQLLNAVNSNENKYQSNLLADTYISESNTEDEALEKAYKIENIELSDATAARIRQKYSEKRRLENQNESDLIGQFYDTVLSKQQTGQMLTYDDIPEGISSKNKLSLMSYINQNGKPKTQDDKWLELYNMSVNNAQGFASLDLNQYRGYLSDGEYKSFVNRQEDIKTGKYYTQIKDDDKMIKDALKAIGLDKNSMFPWGADKHDIAFSEIRAMTREFEARKGRSITDEELLDLTQSLGYKNDEGVKLYKEVEKGMRERTGFIRDVMNDFVYYQQQHNGQMPPNDEKMKIIQQRINNKISEQKQTAIQSVDTVKSNATLMRDMKSTTPKQNEQKVLTYFADSYVPQIEKDLGIKLTVTSRYRNQAGSKHSEGRALDISMSEHTPDERIKIYEKLIASPFVYKLGTSDPGILGTFKEEVAKKDKSKIKDERAYDKRKGTNHLNHVHVTLINTPADTGIKTANNNSNIYTF